jgi:GT2 family glycosyltransferase
MKSNVLVSVIIPTYNRKEKLARCIDSVLASTYKRIEIIIVDDASIDGTEDIIKNKYNANKNVFYIKNNKELLLSATINKGLRIAKGEYVFILDDDNVVDKKCILELVSTFNKYKEAGIVGPLALYYSKKDTIMHAGVIRSTFMRRAIYLFANEKWKLQIKEGQEVEDFANAFMFKRKLLGQVGMWDLLVPFMGEDGDFEARVRKAGHKAIINPKAITYHDVPYNPNSTYFFRVNKMRLYHVMHSKILYVYRYDNLIHKLTFTISIPVYLSFYIRAILKDKNNKFKKAELFNALIKGVIDGFSDSIKHRSKIEWSTK